MTSTGPIVTVQLVREDPTGGEQPYAVFIDGKQSQSCVYARSADEALSIARDAHTQAAGDALAFLRLLDARERGKWAALRERLIRGGWPC